MKRLTGVLIFVVLLAVGIVLFTLFRGEYISKEYTYEGNTDNWKVSVNILETGDKSYNLVTKISYKKEDAPDKIEWYLDGGTYGSGGNQTLEQGEVTKKEPLNDVSIQDNGEPPTLTIEWGNQIKEDVKLSLTESK